MCNNSHSDLPDISSPDELNSASQEVVQVPQCYVNLPTITTPAFICNIPNILRASNITILLWIKRKQVAITTSRHRATERLFACPGLHSATVYHQNFVRNTGLCEAPEAYIQHENANNTIWRAPNPPSTIAVPQRFNPDINSCSTIMAVPSVKIRKSLIVKNHCCASPRFGILGIFEAVQIYL